MKKYIGFSCIAFCLSFGVTQCRASTNCATLAGNLVTNCGFETGTFSGWTLSGNDVPGLLGNLYGVEGTDPFDGISPQDGLFQAYFGDLDSNATTLKQTFATTASDLYTVTFYVAQDTASSAEYGNELIASFGGTALASLSDVAVEGYTEYTYNVDATSGSSVLSLTFGNGLGEFLLDDVSVVQDSAPPAQTPEPAAWTFMLAAAMGLGLLWKRGALAFQTRDGV
jgi:hypothetical protein